MNLLKLTPIAAFTALAWPVLAQQAPDIGQTLRQLETVPLAPTRDAADLQLRLPELKELDVTDTEARFEVKGFTFEGNTQISTELLNQAIRKALAGAIPAEEDWLPAQLSLTELSAVAVVLSRVYREAGYPFAQVYVPAQTIENGQVRLAVLEGRYDKATAQSENPRWAAAAQEWLAPLLPGKVIRVDDLDRVALLLGDLPGVAAIVSVEPGQTPGTAAVEAQLRQKNKYDGEVGLANHGSRYSGEWQARGQIKLNSPFMLGDQIAISALHTDHKMWQGSVNYSAPLGADGWRAALGYSDTQYELTKGFEGTSGNAQVSVVSLSYPLLRARGSNVGVSVTAQEKRLFNNVSNGASIERYSVSSVPLAVTFDHRDQLGAGGITYGLLSWTAGDLKRDGAIGQGSYGKLNLDIARIQKIDAKWNVFGRVAAQWANKNLDSTEGFGLGGPRAVRAYPTGESFGDEGWLAQIELRYAMGAYAPYVFYDHGRIQVNAKPGLVAMPSPDQERAGAGFGLRYERQAWQLDAAVAWRTTGGAPSATQGSDPKPRTWVSLSYKF